MAISIFPITANFAAEIGEVDLSRPVQADDLSAIKQAFWKYSVLVFPEQSLSHQQHVDFAALFGPLEISLVTYRGDQKLRIREDIVDVSNLDLEERPWGTDSRQRMLMLGNRLWHTDSSFRRVPALASLLYARSIAPIGGHTEFTDLRAAWNALPAATRTRIANLTAEHSLMTSRAKLGFTDFSEAERAALPTVTQVLVRTIPETGERSLYLASHAGRVLELRADESQRLLEELIEHATQRQFVYVHRWRKHDLVMWDNRCTMHRGTDFDDLRWPRDMQRATVLDIGNTVELRRTHAIADVV